MVRDDANKYKLIVHSLVYIGVVKCQFLYREEYYTYFLAQARHGRGDLLGAEGQEQVYYGLPNPIQESCFDVDICPNLVLTLVSALGAAALLGMYVAATQNANGKRKRRRSLGGPKAPPEGLHDLIIHGKESL